MESSESKMRVNVPFFVLITVLLLFPVFILGAVKPLVGEFNYYVFLVVLVVDLAILAYGTLVLIRALDGRVEWVFPGQRG